MPSPNTLALPRAARERGQRWTCHPSRTNSGKLYVHDKKSNQSFWLDDVCSLYQCYIQYLADAPEQKAGGEPVTSRQARCHPLCREFFGLCGPESCRYRDDPLPEEPVTEGSADAVAAPVLPLRENAAANALLFCEDYVRGRCRRGQHCKLPHVAVPLGACKHFSSRVIASLGPIASIGM